MAQSGSKSTAQQLAQAEKSVEALRQQRIDEIKQALAHNSTQVDEIAAATAALSTELSELTGETAPAAPAKRKTRKASPGRKGGVTLSAAIVKVLKDRKNRKNGMRIKDLAVAVREVQGFESRSKDLRPLIAQALRKAGAPFVKISHGTYKHSPAETE